MKLICAHKLSECLNFVSLFITPSKGVLTYNSVCLGLPRWSAQFFVNSLRIFGQGDLLSLGCQFFSIISFPGNLPNSITGQFEKVEDWLT